MEPSSRTPDGTPIFRALTTIPIILPVIGLFILFQYTSPHFEVWLAEKTNGCFRRDAFELVATIMPTFMAMLGCTSLLASYLIIAHREKIVFILFVGPAFWAAAYLLQNGFADPAWFIFLPVLRLGWLLGHQSRAYGGC